MTPEDAPPQPKPASHITPETRAWRILVAAFSVFILLCLGAAYLTYWFIFQSSVPMSISLTTARGTVRVIDSTTQTEIAVTDRRDDLEAGTTFRTDATSQAIVTIRESGSTTPIFSVTLLPNSQLSVVDARGPRFPANRQPFTAQIQSSAGASELLVIPPPQHEAALTFISPQARISAQNQAGFTVDTSDRATAVEVRQGPVTIVKRATNARLILDSTERAVVDGTDSPAAASQARVNLIENADLTPRYQLSWELNSAGAPAGEIENTVFSGRTAILIDRGSETWPGLTLGHGETGLVQEINRSVAGHSSLELRATFYVDEQSLSACGTEGSECPLMVRIQYEDIQGVPREFIQGFYAFRNPALDYPLRCATCTSDHEQVNLDSWYTFRSGNLLTRLPAEQKPEIIVQVWFYASGHAYRVYVAELSLLAAQ
jgi:hypothetical protein